MSVPAALVSVWSRSPNCVSEYGARAPRTSGSQILRGKDQLKPSAAQTSLKRTSAQDGSGARAAASGRRKDGLSPLLPIAISSVLLSITGSRDGDDDVTEATQLQPAQPQQRPSAARHQAAAPSTARAGAKTRVAGSLQPSQLIEDPNVGSQGGWSAAVTSIPSMLGSTLRSITGSVDDAGDLPPFSGLPIVGCAGGGIYFFWELGVLKYLSEKYDLSRVEFVGASAGGLVSTLAACGVDADTAVKAAYRISMDNDVFERPGGLAGIWGGLVRQWLDELLPANAAELCNGRVRLVVTEVPSLRLRYLSNFESKEDLIAANMASVHIPFFLDGNPSYTYRGRTFVDGSLWDFIKGNNSNLITCDGRAAVIDYFDDLELSRNRLSFLQLADYEQVLALVRKGVAFAQRQEAAGVYEVALGEVRKSPLRRAVELPVRVVSNVVRQAVV